MHIDDVDGRKDFKKVIDTARALWLVLMRIKKKKK